METERRTIPQRFMYQNNFYPEEGSNTIDFALNMKEVG
jgi:hypothetical protein